MRFQVLLRRMCQVPPPVINVLRSSILTTERPGPVCIACYDNGHILDISCTSHYSSDGHLYFLYPSEQSLLLHASWFLFFVIVLVPFTCFFFMFSSCCFRFPTVLLLPSYSIDNFPFIHCLVPLFLSFFLCPFIHIPSRTCNVL